jgi:copper transport outer membrane protein MctB
VINFRYHIVSLMAVFIALAVGIAVGVSLSPSVDEGILAQATQDRKQVTDLRAEIDRRNALDSYRQSYDQQVGQVVLAGELSNTRVALVSMPDAPTTVTDALTTALEQSGATVVADVKVGDQVFDPAKAEQVDKTLNEVVGLTGNTAEMSTATRFGRALARAVAAKGAGTRDVAAKRVGAALASAGLANVRQDVDDTAQLIIVVTAPGTTPPVPTDELEAHAQTELALKQQDQAAVVVAGPNSDGLAGTDVLTIRTTSAAAEVLSTVDVADLSSGVTTSVLAGQEQLLGRHGHYGALARADGPAPTLPVR